MSEAYYWCLDHERVEGEDGCPNYRRMGPYATVQEAEGALDRARARTAEWDAQEQAEDEWGENGPLSDKSARHRGTNRTPHRMRTPWSPPAACRAGCHKS